VIRFCSLGSGSGGNALLVEVSHGSRVRRLLVDCGFGPRTLAQRLQARAGLALTDLDGLLLTHEHADHVAGVRALLARHTLTVAATRGTWLACGLDTAEPRWLPISPGSEFTLADAQIFAVPVAHDAAEPVQFVITDGDRRLGIVTDLGGYDEVMVGALDGVAALVLECNHDVEMLEHGPYPPFLKARIGGPRGHLSNRAAAGLLAALDRRRLRIVVAAHLSEVNNRPELAQQALGEVLGVAANEVDIAHFRHGLPWRTV